jgi:hypothetical protein
MANANVGLIALIAHAMVMTQRPIGIDVTTGATVTEDTGVWGLKRIEGEQVPVVNNNFSRNGKKKQRKHHGR